MLSYKLQRGQFQDKIMGPVLSFCSGRGPEQAQGLGDGAHCDQGTKDDGLLAVAAARAIWREVESGRKNEIAQDEYTPAVIVGPCFNVGVR